MASPQPVVTTFVSTLESVEAAVELIRQYAANLGFEDDDNYLIDLAGREILVNALKHGNRFDPAKKIELRLSNNGSSMIIEVLDEGDGFRLDEVPDPRSPANLERRSGRGLLIALGVMDEFFAEKNTPSGTHIRMVKNLKHSEAD